MNTILLFVGVALLATSKKSISGTIEDTIKGNLTLKIDKILLRSLRAERTTIAFVINLKITNNNIVGGQLNRVFGFINYKGFDLGTFQLVEAIQIPAKEETVVPFEVYVDVSNRGVPALIRNLWRTGVFDGNVTLIGGIDTTFGTFQFREVVPILQ